MTGTSSSQHAHLLAELQVEAAWPAVKSVDITQLECLVAWQLQTSDSPFFPSSRDSFCKRTIIPEERQQRSAKPSASARPSSDVGICAAVTRRSYERGSFLTRLEVCPITLDGTSTTTSISHSAQSADCARQDPHSVD